MKKIIQKAGTVLMSMLVLVFAAFPVFTLAAAPGSDIGFYVKAQIPENQIDKSLTYFDLLVQPGQTQVLAVDIFNDGDEEVTLQVSAISASTNRNGIIDYKTPQIKDKTLAIPFSEIATIAQPNIVLAPGQSTTAQVTVAMPGEKYDGVVLGSIVVTQIPAGQQHVAETDAASLSIQNVYSYLIGVKLAETDVAILPDFEMDSAVAESVNYQSAITHYIRNKAAAIVKNMSLNVDVYKQGTNEVVAHVEQTGVDMAPNSVMPLAVTTPDGSLEPGDYTSIITIEENGSVHTLETSFTIEKTEIDNIEKSNVPVASTSFLAGFPLWAVFAGVAILFLLIIFFLLLLLFKRRKKEEEEPALEAGQPQNYKANQKK